MKKIMTFFTVVFVSVGSANSAQNVKGGGFVGPNAAELKVTTVAEVSKLRDDTSVFMQGNIINSLGDEKYIFKDKTGQIMVEIDDDDWNGMTVTPDMTVRIYGEVDKGLFKKTKIDVDSIDVQM